MVLANASLDIAFHDTYYVVAQMGLNSWINYYVFGYMLGIMSLGCYLLYIFYYYLFKIDAHRKLNFLYIYSEKDNKPVILKNTDIQLAENCIEFSETTRQISDLKGKDLENFFKWLAGIIDGDGNFDIRNINSKLVLKAIRIKLHDRDIRILNRIQNTLHIGRIRSDKNKPHSMWIISKKEEMLFLINNINGLIRLKVDGLKKSCDYFGAMWSRISLLCLELSNSGDALKLMIPSSCRKTTSGWTNHSCKVISHKMMETEIGYRGSKSITL